MNRQTAQLRRMTIREIVKAAHPVSRSVDDWYNYVGNQWPNGWAEAPAKNTVKSVLESMCAEGQMTGKIVSRGWFTQNRYWLAKDKPND